MPKVVCGFCNYTGSARVSRVTGKLYCAICGRYCVTEICPTKRAVELATAPANEVDEITLAIRALCTAIAPPIH